MAMLLHRPQLQTGTGLPDRPEGVRQWAVERALQQAAVRGRVHPVQLRSVLVDALLEPLRRAFEPCCSTHRTDTGTIRLGGGPERRRLVRLAGLRLLLPQGEALDPGNVTLIRRSLHGGVQVRTGVAFGQPSTLARAAVRRGLHGQVAVDAIDASVRALALLGLPLGSGVRARHTADGWVPLRVVDVVRDVGTPVSQIGLPEARLLVAGTEVGEQVGVSLPTEDWLTPVLTWTLGAG